jgi:hypothetical protein
MASLVSRGSRLSAGRPEIGVRLRKEERFSLFKIINFLDLVIAWCFKMNKSNKQ